MRNYSIKNTKWLNRGHELDYFAALISREYNNFYLVGTESEIRLFWNRIGKDINRSNAIKGIVLTEPIKKINGIDIPIIKDVDIPNEIRTVVICTSFDRKKYETIRHLFEEYGFEENKQFFQAEIFAMIYEVYVLDKIIIDRIEIFMTSLCSLKCEKCIAYIPYFKEQEVVPLEQLKSDADILFSKVDGVRKFKILGGEGFLYPDLVEYIDYIGANFGNKIESFRLGTNGTIIPKKEILEAAKRNKVTIDISDYTCGIGHKSKIDEIKLICMENGIAVDVKRTGEQWLDMGFPNERPGAKSEEKLRQHFAKCAMFCRDFSDGKLFFCCSNFAATKAKLFPLNENDYFDFSKEFSKQELLEYELGFSNLGHTTFCAACRGCSDEVNPYHVEVAKQI